MKITSHRRDRNSKQTSCLYRLLTWHQSKHQQWRPATHSTPSAYLNITTCYTTSHFGGKRKDEDTNNILSRPAQPAYGFQLRSCPEVCQLFIQTLPDLPNRWVPENPAQIEFCAGRYWIFLRLTVYVYLCTRQSRWNPNCSEPEPARQQHDLPAAFVIAQQYSSATFISLHFHSRKEISVTRFKKRSWFNFVTSFLTGQVWNGVTKFA